MHSGGGCPTRRFLRTVRPAGALALVAAQCVAAFGFPVVVRAGEAVRACGCKGSAPSGSCCGAGGCCAVPPDLRPAPEPAATPSCCAGPAVETDPPARVAWVQVTAGGCRGDGPLGLSAETPSVPPALPGRAANSPARTGVIHPADRFPTSVRHLPADPPPRRA